MLFYAAFFQFCFKVVLVFFPQSVSFFQVNIVFYGELLARRVLVDVYYTCSEASPLKVFQLLEELWPQRSQPTTGFGPELTTVFGAKIVFKWDELLFELLLSMSTNFTTKFPFWKSNQKEIASARHHIYRELVWYHSWNLCNGKKTTLWVKLQVMKF